MRKLELVQFSDIDLEDTTYCARLDFPDESIEKLASSIRDHGLRNPPAYIRNGNRLSVMFGWRRTLAIGKIGWAEFESWVYSDLDTLDAHFHNLNDNLERENLSVLEVANKVKIMRDLEIPVEVIAKRTNVGVQRIYDMIKLTEMESEIQRAVHANDITLYKAIEIHKFPVSKRLEMLSKTIGERLSVSTLKQIRRDENPIRIAESTQHHIEGLIAKAKDAGVEIEYKDVEAHILAKDTNVDSSIHSKRLRKVSGGNWAVEIPYDWKERQEAKYGSKLHTVNVVEQEDGSLLITPNGGS